MASEKLYIDLIVIGSGGTGTYFLKEISRLIMGNRSICSLHIFDGDTVEKKNLARQSFQEEDIGRNKACVMAEVLNQAFGLDWVAHDFYVTDPEQVKRCFTVTYKNTRVYPVIVGCVDNHAARLLMEQIFEKEMDCILLDSGNEFSTGEVVLSYKKDGRVVCPARSSFFPEIKDGDLRSRVEMSCEELNQAAPQHIFTNMMAGNILASGVSNLLDGVMTPGVVYFNARKYQTDYVPFRMSAGTESKKEGKANAAGRKGRKKKENLSA